MKLAILLRGQIERPTIEHTLQHSYECRQALLNNIVQPLRDNEHEVDLYCTGYTHDEPNINQPITKERKKYFSFYDDDNIKLYNMHDFINIYDEHRQPREMTGLLEPKDWQKEHVEDYQEINSHPKFFKTHQQLHQQSVFLQSIYIDFNWEGYDYLIILRSDIMYKQHAFWTKFITDEHKIYKRNGEHFHADFITPFPEQTHRPDRFCDTLHIIRSPHETCANIYNSFYHRDNLPNPPRFLESPRSDLHELPLCFPHNITIDYITGHAQWSGAWETSFYCFPSGRIDHNHYHDPAITSDPVCDSMHGTTENEMEIIKQVHGDG